MSGFCRLHLPLLHARTFNFMISMNRNGCLLTLAALLASLQIATVNRLDAQELPESVLLVDEGEEYTYFKGTAPPPDDWTTLEFDDFEI